MMNLKPIAQDKLVFQFKILIEGSKPEIYRTVQVPVSSTFDEFHEIIQKAFAWHNEHLYHFKIDVFPKSRCYLTIEPSYDDMEPMIYIPDGIEFKVENGQEYLYIPAQYNPDTKQDLKINRPKTLEEYKNIPMEYLFFMHNLDSEQTRLSDFVRVGQVFDYCYDMGDYWVHQILCEGLFVRAKGVRYPICIDGQGNHLFENVGGIDGYYHVLEILQNPQHEDYQHLKEWLEECYGRSIRQYDANHIDISKIKVK